MAAAAAAAKMERTPVVVAVHDCDPGADPDALEVSLYRTRQSVCAERHECDYSSCRHACRMRACDRSANDGFNV